MSESFFDTYGVNDSGNDTEQSGDDSEAVPNPLSEGYESLGDLKADVGRALEGHPSDDVGVPPKDDDGERHPSGAMETWWVALHDAKGVVGNEQREVNDFSMSDFRSTYGRTLGTIDHEDLTEGEKAQMRDAGIDLDEVEMPRRIPAPATGRLPVFVTDENELNEALQLLDDFVNEVVEGKSAAYKEGVGTSEAGGDDESGDDTSEAGEPESGAEAIRAVLSEDADLAASAAASEAGYRQEVVEAVEARHGYTVSKNQVTKAKGDIDLTEVEAPSEDEGGDEGDDEESTSEAGDDDGDDVASSKLEEAFDIIRQAVNGD